MFSGRAKGNIAEKRVNSRVTEFLDLILSLWRPLSSGNQSIDLPCESMDWFLYDNGPRHERVNDSLELIKATYFNNSILQLATFGTKKKVM